MIYLLDANVISDLLTNQVQVTQHVEQHIANHDILALTPPIYYELLRGLIRRKAQKKLAVLQNKIMPELDWIALHESDWEQAANFWSQAISAGKSLSDMDFLVAAIAQRLNAILVSSDRDFAALPIKRENWREP